MLMLISVCIFINGWCGFWCGVVFNAVVSHDKIECNSCPSGSVLDVINQHNISEVYKNVKYKRYNLKLKTPSRLYIQFLWRYMMKNNQLVDNFVDCGFFVSGSRHNVLVVSWYVAAKYWGCFLWLWLERKLRKVY